MRLEKGGVQRLLPRRVEGGVISRIASREEAAERRKRPLRREERRLDAVPLGEDEGAAHMFRLVHLVCAHARIGAPQRCVVRWGG